MKYTTPKHEARAKRTQADNLAKYLQQAAELLADVAEERACGCGCGERMRVFKFAPDGATLPGHSAQQRLPWVQ